MANKVVCFKLRSGEEIIAYLEGRKEITGEYIISKARRLQTIQQSQGKFAMMFFPWLNTNPDISVPLPLDFVAFAFAADMQTEADFVQSTTMLDLSAVNP